MSTTDRVTYDLANAVHQPGGGYIARRTDIADSEGCYVALDEGQRRLGFMQKFKDGTVGYWREPCEQAKSANSMEEAFKRVAVGA